jgi:hypothetical protein
MFVYQNNTGGIEVTYTLLPSAPGIILAYSGMSTTISY